MKQKPSPITPEASAALAKKKADAAVMPLSRYFARARDIGVQDFRFRFTDNSGDFLITLKGRFNGQTAIVEVTSPKDHPPEVYLEQALQEFEQGLAKLAPALPPDVPALDAAQEQAEAQQRQAEAWVKHGDIRKPAPAGAGKRKPLGLPLCKFCKTQPVQEASSEFCGHYCARDWYVENARKSVAAQS